MAEPLDTVSSGKLGGFWSKLEACLAARKICDFKLYLANIIRILSFQYEITWNIEAPRYAKQLSR